KAPELPAGLAATSLRLAVGRALDREEVLSRLLAELERWTDALVAGGAAPVVAAWRARSSTFGRRGAQPRGIAVDIDETGALVVETRGGRLHVPSASWPAEQGEGGATPGQSAAERTREPGRRERE